LVSKAGVVRVLHDGHELDAVVAKMLDPGEDVVSEFVVGGDLAFRRRDSNCFLSFIEKENKQQSKLARRIYEEYSWRKRGKGSRKKGLPWDS